MLKKVSSLLLGSIMLASCGVTTPKVEDTLNLDNVQPLTQSQIDALKPKDIIAFGATPSEKMTAQGPWIPPVMPCINYLYQECYILQEKVAPWTSSSYCKSKYGSDSRIVRIYLITYCGRPYRGGYYPGMPLA